MTIDTDALRRLADVHHLWPGSGESSGVPSIEDLKHALREAAAEIDRLKKGVESAWNSAARIERERDEARAENEKLRRVADAAGELFKCPSMLLAERTVGFNKPHRDLQAALAAWRAAWAGEVGK